jgi:hypothetical protein
VTGISEPATDGPALVVISGGEPGGDELAALVIALGTLAGDARPAPRPPSRWADRRASLRTPLDHGPGRWLAGARPSR